ncbi:GAF domain-containing protein [Rhizobium sp. 0TCS1.26]|uniref:GAF domain-containing protein n=1 Tax=Rhizobium sp. 0TCS1.26 TaxID=3142623 RepID=UPI003D2BDDAC
MIKPIRENGDILGGRRQWRSSELFEKMLVRCGRRFPSRQESLRAQLLSCRDHMRAGCDISSPSWCDANAPLWFNWKSGRRRPPQSNGCRLVQRSISFWHPVRQMDAIMQRFILRQNIHRFEEALKRSMDDREKAMLQGLLAEARRALQAIEKIWLISCPHLGISTALGTEAEDLLDHSVQIQHADHGSLQLYDGTRQSLFLIAQCNFDSSFTERFHRINRGSGSLFDTSQSQGETLIVDDLTSDERFSSLRKWALQTGIRSLITIPVLDKAEFLGTFSFLFVRPAVRLPRDTIDRLTGQFRSLLTQMTAQ